MLTLHPKTAGAGIGGALALVILWIVSYWVDVPPEVAAAIAVMSSAFISWLASWKPRGEATTTTKA